MDKPDYKQLCADLVAWAEKTSAHYYSEPRVLIQARAALAEPEPERLTVAQIKELPNNGENFIWEDPRGTGRIDLDGTFSRDDLQQLANSLPIAAPRSENDQ